MGHPGLRVRQEERGSVSYRLFAQIGSTGSLLAFKFLVTVLAACALMGFVL
ncbi:hypothetical protein FOHLNKBM_0507 [Methylobacterium longum]|nr:hypothetical protein FOHLNKBM_0507 [Methylobacterium longum]